jgi:predicted esterase
MHQQLRVLACVCTLLSLSIVSRRSAASAESETREPKSARTLAFAPQNRGSKQPVFVYLHGIDGTPEKGCKEFVRSVNSYGWLVCPRANIVSQTRGYSWGGTMQSQWQTVQSALESIAQEPEVDRNAPVVLLGFSQGALVAADFIRAYPKKIRAAVFVGGAVRFTKSELETAGVSKVGFAAGENDGAYAYMTTSAKTLELANYAVQFRGLGKVGHTYVGESEASSIDSLVSWIATD